MIIVTLILNMPFTLIGVVPLVFSGPYNFKLHKNPYALIVKVKKFWWVFGHIKNARAMTIGYIVLLGPKELKNDLEHEIIHVKQYERYPLIYPFLYLFELLTKGNPQNRFEDVAYTLSKSIYKGKPG